MSQPQKELEEVRKTLSYFTLLMSSKRIEEPFGSSGMAAEVSHFPVQYGSHESVESPPSHMALDNGDRIAEIHISRRPRNANESISTFSMDNDGIEEPMSTSNTPSYDEVIEILPADLRMLLRAYRERFPLSLFCSTLWPFLPVELPSNILYVFLGQFHVLNIEVSLLCRKWIILMVWEIEQMTEDVNKPTSKAVSKTSLDLTITVSFEWRPEDSMYKWYDFPWWIPHTDESDMNELPIGADDGDNGDGSDYYHTSAFVPASWVCIRCGKINRMRWVTRSNCECRPIVSHSYSRY